PGTGSRRARTAAAAGRYRFPSLAGAAGRGRVHPDPGAGARARPSGTFPLPRLTIDPDTRTERGYLDLLAGRLGLPDALVDHVEATVAAAKVPAGTSPNPRW
ncbi:MAG: DUF533 domain-containing protein, partial [Mesorhizobium sp.]